MHIEVPDIAEAPAIADLWTDLATDQRRHGSHVDVEANREAALESVSAHTVADELFVARKDDELPEHPSEDLSGDQSDDAAEDTTEDSTDDLLGFVMFGMESDRFVRTTERGVVHNVYVVPAARERGVGSALLDAAEQALADRGAEAVVLSVLAENESARRLYRERGYAAHRLEMERPIRSSGDEPGGANPSPETGKSDRDKTE